MDAEPVIERERARAARATAQLAECRSVLAQAIWRLEVVCQEVDSTFCRDALTGLRTLLAAIDAAQAQGETDG